VKHGVRVFCFLLSTFMVEDMVANLWVQVTIQQIHESIHLQNSWVGEYVGTTEQSLKKSPQRLAENMQLEGGSVCHG
jgi:hypothetical protein